MTLRNRLLAGILGAALLPTLGMVVTAYVLGQRAQLDFVSSRSISVTKEVVRQMDLRHESYATTADTLADDQRVSSALRALRVTKGATSTSAAVVAKRDLDSTLPTLATAGGYEDILLYDNKGTLLYATSELTRKSIGSVPSAGLLKEAFQHGSPNTSATFILPDTEDGADHYSVFLSRSFRDERSLQGLLVLHIPLTVFQNILEAVRSLGNTAESYLVLNEGVNAHIVSSTLLKESSNLVIPMSGPRGLGAQQAAKGNTGNGVVTDYKSQHSIAAWSYVPSLQLGVVTNMEYVEALSSIRHVQQILGYVLIGLVLLVIGAVGWVVQHYVAAPLKHLTIVSQQLAAGESPDHVDHTLLYHHDEIGKIATSLHNLAQTVKHGVSATSHIPSEAPKTDEHRHG